ncbi:tail fiber protein [Achromobacter insuavis]|uniref:tail fiber protein n=1 Tax=Achromobacter insuavis TaxID=1287735 RepID=UPI001EEBB6E4|nr:tail fiber protein [Achromobacter insuavis]
MAETNFFELFKATWAQNGTTDRISAAQYGTGWAYIGSLPPSVEQFNAVQQLTDQKLTWIYRHLEAVATLTGRALTAPGSDAISYAFQNLNASRLTAGTVPAERLPEKAPAMTVGAAAKWETPRSISISGGATAAAKPFDGSANLTLDVTSVSMNMAAGVLAPIHGGTGLDWIPPGNYLVGNGTATMTSKTSGQVLADIGAAPLDSERRIPENHSRYPGVVSLPDGTDINLFVENDDYYIKAVAPNAPPGWAGQGLLRVRAYGSMIFQEFFHWNGSAARWWRARASSTAWGPWHKTAELDGPAFTGMPTAPTPAAADRSTRIATTAFVADNSLRKCSAKALPATDVGPVFVTEFGEIWSWVSTPSYTGYRSPNCGQIAYFATESAPPGWLKANGYLILKTAYPGLFGAVGTKYGPGEANYFKLLDLRGEFVRGWDDGRGVDSGRAFGTAQFDAFQGHRHRFVSGSGYIGSGTYGAGFSSNSVDDTKVLDAISDGVNGTPRTANETRPRNVALLACIKI